MVVKAFFWKRRWDGCLDKDRGDACSGDPGDESRVVFRCQSFWMHVTISVLKQPCCWNLGLPAWGGEVVEVVQILLLRLVCAYIATGNLVKMQVSSIGLWGRGRDCVFITNSW